MSEGPGTAGPARAFKPYISPEASPAEFTPRAVLLGIFFGLFFGAVTVYLALKVGLTVSASIPIAVLSIVIFKAVGGSSILENNIVQTTGRAGESIAFGVGGDDAGLGVPGLRPGATGGRRRGAVLGGWLGNPDDDPAAGATSSSSSTASSVPRGDRLRQGVDRRRARGSNAGTASSWASALGFVYLVHEGLRALAERVGEDDHRRQGLLQGGRCRARSPPHAPGRRLHHRPPDRRGSWSAAACSPP